MWDLIFGLNALRNDLAHQLASPKFDERLNRFLQAHLRSYETPEARKIVEALSVPDQPRRGVAYLMGFLGSFESDAQGYRRKVDAIQNVLRDLR